MIQIPHQPLGPRTNIFWFLLTHMDPALLFEAQHMGKLGPAVAQDSFSLPDLRQVAICSELEPDPLPFSPARVLWHIWSHGLGELHISLPGFHPRGGISLAPTVLSANWQLHPPQWTGLPSGPHGLPIHQGISPSSCCTCLWSLWPSSLPAPQPLTVYYFLLPSLSFSLSPFSQFSIHLSLPPSESQWDVQRVCLI